jgi:hypothetical protein
MTKTRSQTEQEIAESFGATAEPDAKRGYGWSMYRIGNRLIWECAGGRTGVRWAVAVLEDGRYHSHRYFDGGDFSGLREALQHAAS